MSEKVEHIDELLIDVKKVHKKFCKNLKRGMIYGFLDLFKFNKKKEINLRKDEFWALKDISFTLKRGEILAIVGLNGAGKTSLIRLITNSFPVTKGTIKVIGRIATIFEKNRSLNKFYSGRENIKVKCALFGMNNTETNNAMDKILEFAEIKDFADAPFGSYSAGMKARMNFSIAYYSKPDILIIDEGFATSDRRILEKYLSLLKENSKKYGIIIISHNEHIIRQLSNRIMILKKGQIFHDSIDVSKGLELYNNNKNNIK